MPILCCQLFYFSRGLFLFAARSLTKTKVCRSLTRLISISAPIRMTPVLPWAEEGRKTCWSLGSTLAKPTSKNLILPYGEFWVTPAETDLMVLLMNLYAGRHTYLTDLPVRSALGLMQQNLEVIQRMIDEQPEVYILACWGDNILIRPYLQYCYREIVDSCKDKTIY